MTSEEVVPRFAPRQPYGRPCRLTRAPAPDAAGHEPGKARRASGLTFQQVQKYEKGVNRIGASRLFDLAKVLGVPVQFFYDEAPSGAQTPGPCAGFAEQPDESYVVDFLGTRRGLS